MVWFNQLQCFFGCEGHVALDRNPGPGYDTLLLGMIPGDLLSAFPHRQYVCMYVCMHACMHACMHVCMYGWMDACMYVYNYVCMHI